jgi:hypothetical protein
MKARFWFSVRCPRTMTGTSLSPSFLAASHAAVAGDDAACGIHENRIVEIEGLDAAGDLRDLRVRVSARIPGVRDQSCERPEFHLQAI